MKKIVLVTGANSMLGTHTICRLIAYGYAVRGLLRRLCSYAGPENRDLELIEGDFSNAGDLRNAMRDCDFVIHCAAMTGQSGSYDSYRKINADATEQLVNIAIECGVRRVVNVASANIFAFGTKERPGDESKDIIPPFTESGYARSKYEAVQRLKKFRDKIEIITVCPTFMLGAWDSRPSSGRIILMGYRRRFMFCPPGGKNFVATGDVAIGIVSALSQGRNGESYLLSGENMTYREFYRLLSDRCGYKQHIIGIPKWILQIVGKVGDMATRIGVRSEVSGVNMRMLCIGNYYSNEKSMQELGVSYRPVSEAIDETVSWFYKCGMLPIPQP